MFLAGGEQGSAMVQWLRLPEAERLAGDGLDDKLVSPEGVLALYRGLNAPGMAKIVFDSDFGAALQDRSPKRFGRGYVACWETRNLRMASNIRAVMQERPGVLVVAGAIAAVGRQVESAAPV